MALQLLDGKLLIVDGQLANDPACCCGGCPGLGDVDWFLYLCPAALPSAWCPTEDFLNLAINLGPLSLGVNNIAQPDFTCEGMFLEYGCGGDTDQECFVDVAFTEVQLIVEVTSVFGGYEFHVRLNAYYGSPNCGYGTFEGYVDLIGSDPGLFFVGGAAAKCLEGVYSAGTYLHRNISQNLLCPDGPDPFGHLGFYLNRNSFNIAPTGFYIAPLAELPAC